MNDYLKKFLFNFFFKEDKWLEVDLNGKWKWSKGYKRVDTRRDKRPKDRCKGYKRYFNKWFKQDIRE